MEINKIKSLAERIIAGYRITKDEALELANVSSVDELDTLAECADHIKDALVGNKVELCSIMSVKTGMCSEDCAYCSQSKSYDTPVKFIPLLPKEQITAAAQTAEENGALHFCYVTSGKGPEKQEFEEILEGIRLVKEKTKSIKRCASLGELTLDQAMALKEAGVVRYNHNLDTSENYYPNIITSHTYRDRINTLKNLKVAGIETCCGGIMGMGESWEDRIDLAMTLSELDIDSIPINFLTPIKGTPLENVPPISEYDIIKSIALFRFILPNKILRYAGGRSTNLTDTLQRKGLKSGINAMLIGNYLTTLNRSPNQDKVMIAELGLAPADKPLTNKA